jgi:cell volume regulation protein A
MEVIAGVNIAILMAGLLILIGVGTSLVASRLGAPLLVVFIGIGMLIGEDGPGGVMFDDFRLTFMVGSVSLAIILFDGGLRTRFATFRGVFWPAVALSSVGVVITTVVAGLAASWFTGKPLLEGLLLGAVISSTDAAAVFFLLGAGGVVLTRRVAATLQIESAVNDPVAVFITLLLVQLIQAGGHPTWAMAQTLVAQGLFGAAFGLAGGLAASVALNRLTMSQGLQPLFVAAAAVTIYALTALVEGSGFLAVYIAGLVLGNRPMRGYSNVIGFHDAATWLVQIVMFVLLGLLVTPHNLLIRGWEAAGVALVLMLLARPLAVAACVLPFGYRLHEVAFISWIGLRGAVGIFLAAIPVLVKLPNGMFYFEVAFFVVMASLLIQAWTIGPVARLLGVALPRTAVSAGRVELDLPGQLASEMVGFPVAPDSPILRGVKPPSWARLAMVVRGEQVLMAPDAGPLRAGDWCYWIAPPQRADQLDRLFAASIEEKDAAEAFFGSFIVHGDARLGALATLYDLPVPPDQTTLTLEAAFRAAYDRTPVPGDSITLGTMRLIARSVEDEQLVSVGLKPILADEDKPPPRWHSWARKILQGR